MPTIKARKNSSSPWETVKALPQTGTVRYDQSQSLNEEQKTLARQNIGADKAVTYLTDQILNETEKAQARKNIGITTLTPIVSLQTFNLTEGGGTINRYMEPVEESGIYLFYCILPTINMNGGIGWFDNSGLYRFTRLYPILQGSQPAYYTYTFALAAGSRPGVQLLTYGTVSASNLPFVAIRLCDLPI